MMTEYTAQFCMTAEDAGRQLILPKVNCCRIDQSDQNSDLRVIRIETLFFVQDSCTLSRPAESSV